VKYRCSVRSQLSGGGKNTPRLLEATGVTTCHN